MRLEEAKPGDYVPDKEGTQEIFDNLFIHDAHGRPLPLGVSYSFVII